MTVAVEVPGARDALARRNEQWTGNLVRAAGLTAIPDRIRAIVADPERVALAVGIEVLGDAVADIDME